MTEYGFVNCFFKASLCDLCMNSIYHTVHWEGLVTKYSQKYIDLCCDLGPEDVVVTMNILFEWQQGLV